MLDNSEIFKKKINSFNLNKEYIKKNIFVNIFFYPKAHPEYYEKYKKINRSFYNLILIIIYNFLKLFVDIAKNIFNKKNNFDKIKKNYEFVIISHYLSPKYLFEKDIYFNKFFQFLNQNNIKYLIAYLPTTEEKRLKNLEKKEDIIFFKKKIDLKSEIKILYKIIQLSLFYLNLKEFNIKEKLIILGEVLNSETHHNIKMYLQIKNLFNKLKFDNLITTFEGLNLEKIIFSLSKNNNCQNNIGYQHAPIIKDHNSILEFQDTEYFPDTIFTSGKFYYEILQNKLKQKKIINYGTSKFVFKNVTINKKDNYCLVLPEAIFSECRILFNFCKLYLENFNDIKFIWRVHPMMKINEILDNMKISEKLLKNIHISENNDEDFIKSKFCLFRGSSSVFNAIHHGCFPIYLNLEKNFNINPLYNLNEINYVDNINSLNSLFQKKTPIDMKKMQDEISNYFKEPKLQISDIK